MSKTQIVELQSKGLPYADTTLGASLIDGHAVMVRPYKAKDQKDMVLKSKNTYEFLRQHVASLVEQPKLNEFDELLTGDIIPILAAVKSFTYGPLYSKKIICEACERVVEVVFNLSLFPIRGADGVVELLKEEGNEAPEFKTKGLKVKVEDELVGEKSTFEIGFHLPTLADEKRLAERMVTLLAAKGKDRVIESDNPIDRSWVRMAILIDTIDGDQMVIQDKIRWFGERSTEFMNNLDDAMMKYSIGVIGGVDTPCPSCSAMNEVPLEVDHEFFRAPRGVDKAS